MKKGFTLAEIMIVLTIIGVLTAILLPTAFQARPDKNVLLFKKANSTIGQVIKELATSDEYYKDGLMDTRANDAPFAADYLCKAMANILTIKGDVECRTNSGTATVPTDAASLDTICRTAQNAGAEFTTADGVDWFVASPSTNFDSVTKDTDGFYKNYKVVCFDVDGVKNEEDPFGYGIRVDGKIMLGARAKEWMEKDIQDKD